MKPAERFVWGSAEYAAAFSIMAEASQNRAFMREIIHDVFSDYPSESTVADWGAGRGDLTEILLERYPNVYAVEPNSTLRQALSERCPTAKVLDGALPDAQLPERIDIGIIAHVFFHIPDAQWSACTIAAARQLTDRGALVITLDDRDSVCNAMLDHFGAPRYDLQGVLAKDASLNAEFDLSFQRIAVETHTRSYDDTLAMARVVLCDRGPHEYSRLPSEDEFREYVRTHFWNEDSGIGGWTTDVVYCTVRRR
jgi:trans-aconitate methyltransferase